MKVHEAKRRGNMRLGRQCEVPISLEESQPVIKKITELEALRRMSSFQSREESKRIIAGGDALARHEGREVVTFYS
jgi:hypothetical protein